MLSNQQGKSALKEIPTPLFSLFSAFAVVSELISFFLGFIWWDEKKLLRWGAIPSVSWIRGWIGVLLVHPHPRGTLSRQFRDRSSVQPIRHVKASKESLERNKEIEFPGSVSQRLVSKNGQEWDGTIEEDSAMNRHRSLTLFPLAGSSIPLWFIPLLAKRPWLNLRRR